MTTPPRRWFRFSLRTLFIVVTLVGVGIWLAPTDYKRIQGEWYGLSPYENCRFEFVGPTLKSTVGLNPIVKPMNSEFRLESNHQIVIERPDGTQVGSYQFSGDHLILMLFPVNVTPGMSPTVNRPTRPSKYTLERR